MKKILLLSLIFLCLGCTTVEIPNYIKDDHPYKKTFYAKYENVLVTVKSALKEMGWEITQEAHPSVYERRTEDPESSQVKEILLFTNTKKFPFLLGTSYYRVNVQLMSKDENVTEIDARFLKVSSIAFKTFTNFKRDGFMRSFFEKIEKNLVK